MFFKKLRAKTLHLTLYLSTCHTCQTHSNTHTVFLKIALKFSKKLTGKTQDPPRWRKCVSAASGSLGKYLTLIVLGGGRQIGHVSLS